MMVKAVLLVVVLSGGLLGGCTGAGATLTYGATPYYGPGSPPRESLPPERELKPETPGTLRG